MVTYRIFKKSDNLLTFLTPLNTNNKLRVAKLISNDTINLGYNDDGEMYIDIAQCPRIYLGMEPRCKNLETKQYEELGELVDIQYDESTGYLFIFQ